MKTHAAWGLPGIHMDADALTEPRGSMQCDFLVPELTVPAVVYSFISGDDCVVLLANPLDAALREDLRIQTERGFLPHITKSGRAGSGSVAECTPWKDGLNETEGCPWVDPVEWLQIAGAMAPYLPAFLAPPWFAPAQQCLPLVLRRT